MSTQNSTPSSNLLIRLLSTVVFLVIIRFAFYLVALAAVVQLLFVLATQKSSAEVGTLIKPLAETYMDMVRYCLFLTDEMPQPFASWFDKS